MKKISPDKLKTLAKAVIKTEEKALSSLIERVDNKFVDACNIILNCQGRIVVTGMGKSGHIGNKIAATLASTGTPAFFVHPGEASHGDLGMITPDDVVIALSNSGETDEIVALLPVIKRLNTPLITLTGNQDSTLAKSSTVNIDVSVEKEACPLGLAPTSSTTATLAMGDAISIALLETRGFNENDFALSHPGGILGRRLLLRVDDIMHTGEEIPKVFENSTLNDALVEMSAKGLGVTTVVNKNNKTLWYDRNDIRITETQTLSDVLTGDSFNRINEIVSTPINNRFQLNLCQKTCATSRTFKDEIKTVVRYGEYPKGE